MSLSRTFALTGEKPEMVVRVEVGQAGCSFDESTPARQKTSQERGPLATVCITDAGAFRALEHEWELLYQRCESATPFNSWNWLFSWWQSYGTAGQLRIVTFRRDGELLGVVPLYLARERGQLGWSARILRFIGDGSSDSDYLDWLVPREHQADCAAAFLAWLAVDTTWDVLMLREIPVESPMPGILQAAARDRPWTFRQEQSSCGVLDLPRTFEEFLLARQSRFRTKLRSLLKKLDQSVIVFETASPPATLKRRLRSLFELHQERWAQAGQAGVFGRRAKRLFYARFCPRYARAGWLRLYSLRSADRYLAHQLCFEDRGVVYLLQEGFDVADPASSYGQMLRAAVIRHLIAQGTKRYDFLGGYSKHKASWGAAEQYARHVVLARGSLRARAYFHGPEVRERCASWAKKHLPAPLTASLKRVLRALLPG